jgi:hypothetical protein
MQQAPTASGPSGMGGPNPQQAAQAATLAHAARTGLGFRALMGTHVNYQQTPNGPVPVQQQNKPGDLFRSILAGAIMGGAAGAEGPDAAGSGWSAAGRGAGAARAGQQQAQQQAAAQAQQQWQNQLTAQKEQREQTGFDTEQQVRKAQIAQANAETLRTNMMTQGESFKMHQDVANADKDRISTFVNAGVKPTFEDIPESQMADIMKNSPGASTLDWRHTGVKLGPPDANGNPTYEYTLSAYDPKASAPLSAATIDQWKQDGLFKYHPEYADVAKAGKVLTVDQFTALDKQAQNYSNQTLAKTTSDLKIKQDQAAINKDNAQTAEAYASASKDREETAQAALGKTQAEQFNNALEDLNKAGGDFSKLKPSSRVVIAESMTKMVPTLNTEYKNLMASNDPADEQQARGVLSQIQNLTTLGTRALTGVTSEGKPADPIQATADLLKGKTPQEVSTYLAKSPIPADAQAKIWAALKLAPPKGYTPPAVQAGQNIVRGAANTVANLPQPVQAGINAVSSVLP